MSKKLSDSKLYVKIAERYMGDEKMSSTWKDEAKRALENLGGEASLKEIYEEVEKTTTRKITRTYQASIREALEKNSSDSQAFNGKEDIFYSKGIGSGIWGLRNNHIVLKSELIKYNKYSREEIHDIFSPDTKFTAQAGTWGLQGIIKVPGTQHDYIFFVTYGKKQSGHEFDENISEDGILTWQSQPSQTLNESRIIDFINHDYLKNNIYLFLRTSDKEDYTYMGLLAYVDHDNQREKPVYFKWQILDWDENKANIIPKDKKAKEYEIDEFDTKKFNLRLKEYEAEYEADGRKGKNTKEFYSNKNINFEGEIKKNTDLGNKGEDIVVEYEKSRLIAAGRKELADKVFPTREIAGNAERFDVLSYDKEGNEKYIEVKTTKGGLNNIFHISENEVEFSEKYQDKYYLYRVYNFNIKTMSADLKIIKGAINREKLHATNYICRIGENNKNL